jgi:hypothetical protein
MRRYRYRTKVLTGRWRDSFDAAVGDAARAGQIAFENDDSAFRWIVPGSIEEREEDGGEARRA